MVVVIVVPAGFCCGLFGYFACRFGFRGLWIVSVCRFWYFCGLVVSFGGLDLLIWFMVLCCGLVGGFDCCLWVDCFCVFGRRIVALWLGLVA